MFFLLLCSFLITNANNILSQLKFLTQINYFEKKMAKIQFYVYFFRQIKKEIEISVDTDTKNSESCV